MPMPTVHPLPVNPTTGQQPLAALRSLGGTAQLSTSAGGVNREVLKQLQDVAWSDEEDDPDCMVCAEPLDLSDQNFKPCPCGLQICQFCYHKLLRDDPRCPGCRRRYDSAAVEFQPVDFDEVRRAKDKKMKRAKICKQLDTMGRRHMLDTRIVMKNSVYVVGMKIPGSGSPEEAVSILRSNDYFGQYGKIARLFLRDRAAITPATPGPEADSPSTSTGIYIVYVRREDAARAISSLDGIPAPQGPAGQSLHASYGTTRYCDSFLRGLKCDQPGCQNLHEWGGEGDCFTRNDLETALIRPAEYDARQKQQQLQPPPLTQKSAWPKPAADDVDSSALPRTANWGMRPMPARPGSSGSGRSNVSAVGSQRPTKIQSTLIPLGGRNSSAFPPPSPSPVSILSPKIDKDKKKAQTMSRGRSEASSVSSAAVGGGAGSTQASPRKKPITLVLNARASTPPAPIAKPTPAAAAAAASSSSTSTPAPAAAAAAATATSPATRTPPPPAAAAPPPPPGLGPPPGLAPVVPVSATTAAAAEPTASPPPKEPEPVVASPPAVPRPVSAPEPEEWEEDEQEEDEEPEAGPSTYVASPVKPVKQLSTEYPIHSPYPDFDDIFTEPDARKMGFAFSLALDDSDIQRLIAFSHKVGGFEPSPFDPLLEELPKLGIPLTSLMAVPRYDGPGVVYDGPFSPFAPSSPVETGSLPTSDEPSAGNSSDNEPTQRTASRFEFARRGSLASAGRGQSPFRTARDEWGLGRAPSSNGYAPEDMRPPVPHGYHPALAQLNSHAAAAAAAAAAQAQAAAGPVDSWDSRNYDQPPNQYARYPQQQQQPQQQQPPQQQQQQYGGGYGYAASPVRDSYSPSHAHAHGAHQHSHSPAILSALLRGSLGNEGRADHRYHQ